MSNKFEKIFSRDFSLLAIQIATTQESKELKPWLSQKNKKPYIVVEHTDGTSHIYYDTEALQFTTSELKERVKENSSFIYNVEKEVRSGIEWIRPLYEQMKPLDRDALIHFITDFESVYSWIEAMWWLKSIGSEELGIDISNIEKLRQETEMLSAATDIVIRKSLKNLYPEFDLCSSMISLQEFKENRVPSKEILEERLAYFLQIDDELFVSDSAGQVLLQKQIELIEEPLPENKDSINGQIGCKGRVRGTVCRVMGHADFGKIQEGQILVSPMTMVDFLPEMKKAAGFVTDEGGMMCHAAIVARELKKPCIIGTKIATKILRDGDLIEVDAHKGIVTLIK